MAGTPSPSSAADEITPEVAQLLRESRRNRLIVGSLLAAGLVALLVAYLT